MHFLCIIYVCMLYIESQSESKQPHRLPLHVQVLVPLVDQFFPLVVVHTLPTDELLSLGLFLDAVQNPEHDHRQAQVPHVGDRVAVQDAREGNAEQDPGGHDEGKDDRPKVLDGIKDKELANGAADRKDEKVQVDLRVLHDKGKKGRELVGVDQRDEAEDGRKGAGGKHELDDAEVEVALEQAGLELASKGIKEQKEAKEHDPRPLGGSNLCVAEVVHAEAESEVVGGGHEERNATSND
mmetsp:Transcript_14152/g.39590  ORF Transcript_14152/g.39590 Transcript_14152/m.39590 type:complete len:239 (-) Transcript_14152:1141-1857(-)